MTSGAPPWWERWGDRLNPLVVKEVRQGLRTRIFWVCFGLMLLACVVLSLIAYVNTREAQYTRSGRYYFFAFFVCLGLVHFFVIPYNAYRSLAREREDETWVLLVLTGLGPRRILLGKVASYLVQAALYASAVGPFLLFSYFLNGIALPTILAVLSLGAAWLVFCTVVGVCAATLAGGRLTRGFVHFLLLGTLGAAVVYGLVAAFAMVEAGDRLLGDDDFLYAVGVGLALMLTDGWLLFETAASRLALPTEDYTRGPRRALLTQVLLAALGGVAVWWAEGKDHTVAEVFGIMGALHLIAVVLFVATDVDGLARPMRASTRPWSLLRPGAVRGFRLGVLLLAAWAALWVGLEFMSPRVPDRGMAMRMVTVAIPTYGIFYISVAVLLGRMPRSDRLSSPGALRLLVMAVVGLASSLPPLVAVLVGLDADDGLFNLLNPIMGAANFGTYEYSSAGSKMSWELLAFVVGVTVLAAFAADRVLVEREKRVHAS
ncbi:ABC transporter permease [Pyxidicoccus fallax]|uniref:ABC transporter permease n=2 Tax=Pyxidicoccus fallax TaxID=394095 RepID=A0A848LPX4_9BACT|nr:ABC transporter permease [Pyxidicoccus fallax]NMO19806.1 ABC transporter permease [Pyxidicoccus fallax]NPC85693.1 ABC transporter permease [Pyxidicoccus fallax]